MHDEEYLVRELLAKLRYSMDFEELELITSSKNNN